jgi:hypothetical protein
LLNLIDNSKSDENRIRNEANISYDDLLSKINSEKNKDADYTQLIDNLN